MPSRDRFAALSNPRPITATTNGEATGSLGTLAAPVFVFTIQGFFVAMDCLW